jgi:hypothetical protein
MIALLLAQRLDPVLCTFIVSLLLVVLNKRLEALF